MDSYFALQAPMVPDGKIGGEEPPKFVDHATFVKPVKEKGIDKVMDKIEEYNGISSKASSIADAAENQP